MLTEVLTLGAVGQQAPFPVPVPLWSGRPPMAQGTAASDVPTLTAFVPASNPTKTAVIIAPGGRYLRLSMQKEGFDIARWLNAHGVAAFVLKYRLGPKYHHPVELADAQRAIRTVRAEAAQYGIAPDHIGMWGFSAGGHLAASAGTLFNKTFVANADAIDLQSARPDFLILCYPVITMEDPFTHADSRKYLLGETPSPALITLLSVDQQVTRDTPPTFIYATTDDGTVSVMNSVMFYSALVAAKVPAEMHLFQHGSHGTALAANNPVLRPWTDLLVTWLRGRGMMGPPL